MTGGMMPDISEYVFLDKNKLDFFVSKLNTRQRVVAPVRKGVKSYAFAEVPSAKDISWKYIPTILPPKKYFMPQYETIQKFDKSKRTWETVVSSEPIVILGVHTCDLAGIEFLNAMMSSAPCDAHYRNRKANITLIGIECLDYCDGSASCAVMKNELPHGGYDLFMTEMKQGFISHVGSDRGRNIASDSRIFTPAKPEHIRELEELRARKKDIFKPEINVSHEELKNLFSQSFESNMWREEMEKRCVSCGNCTNVCPTCYCFDLRDELDLSLTTGERQRVWDSCQNETFAKVASGENFRKKKGLRQRHRYMRKFYYPVEKHGLYGCTGCGRCTRTCMAKISLKETINKLAEEQQNSKEPVLNQ